MRIAICDDNEIQIDIFMHRINNFLKRNGDIKAFITPYAKPAAGYERKINK